MDFLKSLIDADKLAGYVRAGVASLFGIIIAKNPTLGAFLSPEIQSAFAVLAAGAVVGVWSHIAKKNA